MVAVVDGAAWLQRFIDVHRPDAIRVLDFPHAVEWIGTQAHALKHDGPASVLAALRALPAGEQRHTALGYLGPRLPQLQYPTFRAAGYPIGSGIVASANTVVVEDRLKGSGMPWAPASVDPLLAPRTVVCANRWDEAWPQIGARLRATKRAHRDRRLRATERRAARTVALAASQAPAASPIDPPARPLPSTSSVTLPPTPTSKTIVNGRPTKAQPWDRCFLPHRPASPAAI